MQTFITLLVAIIGAISTIFAALISRYGFSFWKPAQKIHCRGSATALQIIRNDNSLIDFPDNLWKQEIEDLKIILHGNHVSFSADYKLYKESTQQLKGIFAGSGTFINGQAYANYTITDIEQSQTISGVLQLAIPQWGDITGYYLAQSSIEVGGTVLGKVNLVRSRR